MATKTIGSAAQKGSTVWVYDEKGATLFTKSGELKGWTSSTVTIKQGGTLWTYGADGSTKFTKSV